MVQLMVSTDWTDVLSTSRRHQALPGHSGQYTFTGIVSQFQILRDVFKDKPTENSIVSSVSELSVCKQFVLQR